MTIQLPDGLAQRIRMAGPWLPAIMELSLMGCKTLAVATATEVIQFLSGAPSPADVMQYHVSERGQQRLRRLLALNESSLLSAEEQRELDELQGIEHVVVMLKAEAAQGV